MSLSIIPRLSINFEDRRTYGVSMIILHYTGMKTAADALERLTDPESKVSAHYTVDEDGTVYQHVEEGMRAWHAGRSGWRGINDINSASIGIEIVNPGHEWGYRPFPEPQIQAVIGLCRDISARHDIEDVLAHSDVAPDRKQDPGELFPWKYLAENGIGLWPDPSTEDFIKAQTMDVFQALKDLGYQAVKGREALVAFQRHYVPEIFEEKREGHICSRTRGRLYALLAGHVL